jgi:hypothetical protein
MNVVSTSLWILGALAFAYQLFISLLVVRSASFSGGQKIAQVFLIWLLPVLGAFTAHWVIHSTQGRAPVRDRSFIREDHSHW